MAHSKGDVSRAGAKTIGVVLLGMAVVGLLGTIIGLVLLFAVHLLEWGVVQIPSSIRQLFSGVLGLAGALAF